MKKTSTLLLAACCWAGVARAQAPQTLNYYYGNLHAHSAYSDGNKDESKNHFRTPGQNFGFASASQHFDFLGISEHNHATAGMARANYAKGLRQADSVTVDGKFVALYGMEWGTISGGGHLLVYGVDQLLNWESGNYDVYVPKNDYQALFRQINKRPGAFATLAHPSSGDYGNLAGSAPFSARADSAVVGTVMRSGPAMSTNISYLDPSRSSYESTFQKLLAKGYHVGISLDHDNHYTTFGRNTPGRLVVLAPELTKASLLEAVRARHFYASDDWNAEVRFQLNEQPMGNIVEGEQAAAISVSVTDSDKEALKSLTLLRGTPGSGQLATVVATAPGLGSTLSYTETTAQPGETAYYYAVITQADGDRIVTSPIWYTRMLATAGQAPQTVAAQLDVYPNPGVGPVSVSYFLATPAAVTLEVLDAVGRPVYRLADDERQSAGPHTLQLGTDATPLENGLYIVRLVQNGASSYRRLLIAR
ncbi:CehA/McbA family metallohydrolase [Hymenobacter sp. J193]|uniref:CehA/McbA family metallohydrolase n=1 Tax=Hymenobacter sp. J193 TaxID=2898429 RepID=UPI0021514723|nr:CehA/McbA family metallohydrolase [Hymenobacter sp. J193]MCR5887918.1 CehA/McbA family metallohydrolase [Hymenobacter sp. J193]